MGFIKNLIAGIVGFITGLFSKKGNGYYLELKEEANATPVSAAAPKSTPKPKAAPAAAKVTKAEPVKVQVSVATETNFATKYLIPVNSPRRRPGVNMNAFLDMARQVKTPG